MSKIGYIRVSTEHQETARQQEIMCDYQVDCIFSEKLSGANADRPQLRAMLDYVREGDTLYIESIKRRIHFGNARTYPVKSCHSDTSFGLQVFRIAYRTIKLVIRWIIADTIIPQFFI